MSMVRVDRGRGRRDRNAVICRGDYWSSVFGCIFEAQCSHKPVGASHCAPVCLNFMFFIRDVDGAVHFNYLPPVGKGDHVSGG